MSTSTPKCIFCSKECKLSDSRPYSNNQAKGIIHNRCRIKKSIADKNSQRVDTSKFNNISPIKPSSANFELSQNTSASKEANLGSGLIEKRKKLIEQVHESDKTSGKGASSQFFFDLKAGIAKPHEKKQYLHHRNLCEIASRFDDQGFQAESVGRAYDSSGKDLNTLGDEDDIEESGVQHESEVSHSKEQRYRQPKRPADHGERPNAKRVVREHSNHIKVDQNNPCWFCLASPNVEKHLVLSVGEYCYLTLAKGGLSDDHLLLIPIEHFQAVNDEENGEDLLEELERFKSSLIKFFKKQSKGVVFFERNFRSVHWQLQVVPISLERIDGLDAKIKSISMKHFRDLEYIDIPEKCSLRDIVPPKAPYMYWQIEPTGKKFVSQIRVRGSFFPLQLGRITLADGSLLDKEDKIDWKKCVKSIDDYVRLAEKVKNDYEEFDIT